TSSSPPDTARPAFPPLSLHDALPICNAESASHSGRICQGYVRSSCHCETSNRITRSVAATTRSGCSQRKIFCKRSVFPLSPRIRSEEHTSELQSRENLVCRLLLEKKK